LARCTTPPVKTRDRYIAAISAVYAQREDFEFEERNSGPNMDRTPNELIAKLSSLIGVDLTEA